MTTPVQVQVSLPPISTPVVDQKSGLMNPQWYRWFENMQTRTGGDIDKVALTAGATLTFGNGLNGDGTISSGITINADQDTGWTAATGAGDKGAYIQYPGATVSAGYVQAEAQATDDAVKAASARLVAIEEALRSNGAIDG